jgi:hypothetical protein
MMVNLNIVVKHYWITTLHALQNNLSLFFKKLCSLFVTISQGQAAGRWKKEYGNLMIPQDTG